jgi:transcriptional regulator with XRE-family HTH domain
MPQEAYSSREARIACVRSADLIREARLRAGLTQYELAARSGRERSVIARWEQGVVAPSIETLIELVRACGFDLPLELAPRDPSTSERLRKNALLSPERRVARQLQTRERGDREVASREPRSFDPRAILAALERRRVTYVLIGGLARVIQGSEELTHGLDLVPSLRTENLRRLELALEDIGAERADRKALVLDGATIRDEPLLELHSPKGELKIVAEPAGTRGGYDDLRRAASREPIGKGLRPSVASIGDLARMLAALDREHDQPALTQLRQLAELERGLGRDLDL